jgi:hypothetical protein
MRKTGLAAPRAACYFAPGCAIAKPCAHLRVTIVYRSQPPAVVARRNEVKRTLAAVGIAAAILLAACSSSSPAAAPVATASTTHAKAAAAHIKATPSPSCKLTTTFDYIVRDDDPGAGVLADEIGNVDYVNCVSSLADFAATAGQAQGECTTIALASDNPGYNVNATPAPPLKHVIESAGPGC